MANKTTAKTADKRFQRLRAQAVPPVASPLVFDWPGTRAILRPAFDILKDFRVDLASRREECVSADLRAHA